MKLYAISDLHVGFEANRRLWATLPAHPGDWLILAGDLGETEDHLRFTLEIATARFDRVLWTPGNHELWTLPDDASGLRGEARYLRCVEICRDHGVLTPEDPYAVWPGDGPRCVLAPLFVLYDYSFRPDDIAEADALAWARASGLECTDEHLLHPDPHRSFPEWCRARCAATRARLDAIPADHQTILINHFPLRRELAWLPAIPRFSIWCGTRQTESWHLDYRARVAVSGHLHIPSTRWIDGVRFEEVSLGYPRQRSADRSLAHYLREILPGEPEPRDANASGDPAGASGTDDPRGRT
ncbi:MAG TPA: metallophosphoesterase [Kofleriaceae bacterium]|nr:metallophosphoesterase [Kofleriaceae bacterium]HMG52819.1 metallophosphoesterase [Kofleriaceae bacterium]